MNIGGSLSPLSSKPVEQPAELAAARRTNSRGANEDNVGKEGLEKESLGQNKKEQLEQKLDRKLAQQEALDQQTIQQLAARDREVRNHERAHAAVGGQYASAPRYEYERGPDGVNYAVGGEVSISTGGVSGDPQQTIEKAQVVRRAALAPAEPSAQDRKVAAEATQLEAQARVELAAMAREERVQEQEQLGDLASNETNQEVSAVNEQAITSTQSDASNPVQKTIAQKAIPENTADNINEQQQDMFNQLNDDLTYQLVSLGAAQTPAQSLGSIVSRFA